MLQRFFSHLHNFTLKPIIAVLYFGVELPKNSFQSRITLLTNIMGCWGILTVAATALTLEAEGIGSEYYGISYSLISISCGIILFLNYKKRIFAARIVAVLLLYISAWQAAMIYGKSFNGYLIFYIGIIFSIISLYSERSKILWWLIGLGIFSIFLNDYFYHMQMLPLTGLNSFKFPVTVLWVDSLFISIFITLVLLVEKAQSKKHEETLSSINSNLESIVRRRTKMLLQAKEDAYQYNILKAQFVANTSHEIRTPLQGITGFLQLSLIHLNKLKNAFQTEEDRETGEKLKKSLESLDISTQRLHTLIDRLLELTRVEETDFAPRPCHFNLNSLLKKIIFTLEQKYEGQTITLHNSLSDKEFICFTDPILTQQVLESLLDNAFKYSANDSKTNLYINSDDNTVTAIVVNNGIGIPENEKESIFEAFVQGSLTDKGTGGTGLGLSLARKYSRALNGDVVLSDPSKASTTFIFTFQRNLDLSNPSHNETEV